MLNENANQHSIGETTYYSASYTIKVDSKKQDALIVSLKGIGTLKGFTQNADDITGAYVNQKVEIEAEQARLSRYQDLYATVSDPKEKIGLIDRIFEQERKIKYMQDSLTRMDETVTYSTVSFSMSEERPSYADITLVKLSDLARTFVESINGLVGMTVGLLPWALAILLLRVLWKRLIVRIW